MATQGHRGSAPRVGVTAGPDVLAPLTKVVAHRYRGRQAKFLSVLCNWAKSRGWMRSADPGSCDRKQAS